MKFSTKTKYGVSAMILLAEYYEADVSKSLISLAENLGVSKIYLEQIFSLLKNQELVVSIKGSRGGYKLARSPKDIKMLDVLYATEPSLLEKEELSGEEKNVEIAIHELLYKDFQENITTFFSNILLSDLKLKVDEINCDRSFMYYL